MINLAVLSYKPNTISTKFDTDTERDLPLSSNFLLWRYKLHWSECSLFKHSRHRAPGRSCGTRRTGPLGPTVLRAIRILDLNRVGGAQIIRLDLRVASRAGASTRVGGVTHVYFSSREVFLYKAWANSSSYDEKLNFKDIKFL